MPTPLTGCCYRTAEVTLGAADARFGELFPHDLIVQPCHLTGGFFPYIAGRDVQGLGDLCEHRQIQPCMTVNNGGFILQKVAGEGGIGDDVGAAAQTRKAAPPNWKKAFSGRPRVEYRSR